MLRVAAKCLYRGATDLCPLCNLTDTQAFLFHQFTHAPAPGPNDRLPPTHRCSPSHTPNAVRVCTLATQCASAARIRADSSGLTALPRSHQSTTIGRTPAAFANCT